MRCCRHEMGTGIVEIIGMEIRDGQRYCGDYWNGDTRCAQCCGVYLGWRYEMVKGIVEIIGMEIGDVHSVVEFIWDGDKRWAQVL